jgi:hypothetical protein
MSYLENWEMKLATETGLTVAKQLTRTNGASRGKEQPLGSQTIGT